MLDHMMFNLDQLKVENYVKREPKFLFKVQKQRFVNQHSSLREGASYNTKRNLARRY